MSSFLLLAFSLILALGCTSSPKASHLNCFTDRQVASGPNSLDNLSCAGVFRPWSVETLTTSTRDTAGLKTQILKLINDLYSEGIKNNQLTLFPLSPEDYDDLVNRDKNHKLSRVARLPSGQVVGFSLGYFDRRSQSVYLRKIGVAPTHRRQGLAKTMMCATAARAIELGKSKIVLSAVRSDSAAYDMYLNFDFQIMETETIEAKDPNGNPIGTIQIDWMQTLATTILKHCS